MNLTNTHLRLTTTAINSLVETPTSVKISSDIDPGRFLSVFKGQIFSDALTSEKAVYAAMSVGSKPLPTINSLF